MTDLLIEPLALLHGEQAAGAVRAGVALPLQGGPSAFSLARLLGEPGNPVLPVSGIPRHWQGLLRRVTAAPPPAGLPARPLVMGILNATPDSFSDGGRHLRPADAIAAGLAMIEAGADILDLGGESTRPGSAVIDPPAEQARILPVLEGLRGHGAPISIDTRNAATMRAALDAGADLINDISALAHDPASTEILATGTCAVVLMHMRGTPATMTGLAQYDDVVVDVVPELGARIDAVVQAGIARERIIVDPGIGFAKDDRHNLELLRRLPVLANLGCRVLLGTSRKRFIGRVAAVDVAKQRDPGTIVSSLPGLALPGCILRVHDVPSAVQAVRVWQAIQG